MKHWHKLAVVRQMMTRLGSSNVKRFKRIAIPADYEVLVGKTDEAEEVLTALECFRRAHVELRYGGSFLAAQDEGQAPAYLEVDSRTPSVFDAVVEYLAEQGDTL